MRKDERNKRDWEHKRTAERGRPFARLRVVRHAFEDASRVPRRVLRINRGRIRAA